jgi:hypothetical protein
VVVKPLFKYGAFEQNPLADFYAGYVKAVKGGQAQAQKGGGLFPAQDVCGFSFHSYFSQSVIRNYLAVYLENTNSFIFCVRTNLVKLKAPIIHFMSYYVSFMLLLNFCPHFTAQSF